MQKIYIMLNKSFIIKQLIFKHYTISSFKHYKFIYRYNFEMTVEPIIYFKLLSVKFELVPNKRQHQLNNLLKLVSLSFLDTR